MIDDLPLPVFPNSQMTGIGIDFNNSRRARSNCSSESDPRPNQDLIRSSTFPPRAGRNVENLVLPD
jgi:hypothetical protein